MTREDDDPSLSLSLRRAVVLVTSLTELTPFVAPTGVSLVYLNARRHSSLAATRRDAPSRRR